MRVLVITNLYPPEVIGGYEVQCSQAVTELRERGHDVTVLTTVPRRPFVDREGAVLRLLTTPDVYSTERIELRSPFWEFESNLLNAENIQVLLQVLEDMKPDVCYLWNLVAIGGAAVVAALEAIEMPWVWHLCDAVPSMLCNFNGQLRQLGMHMGQRFSGRFLACSDTVVDRVERLVPIRGRTRIVPNWVTESSPAFERGYFDQGPLRLAYAGRIAEEKGVFLLPEVVSRLRDQGYREFTLDILGTGLIAELADRVAELGVERWVTLVGWVPPEQVRDRLSKCDLFVFPTFSEDSMPIAPLQAASVGCVPILPSRSGISEWMVAGVHCLKAERTSDGFAAVVAKVLDREVDIKGLSQRAVSAVHEDFAIGKVMQTVESELLLAAEGRRVNAKRFDDVYRMALIADGILRRHVVEQSRQGTSIT